MHKKVKAAVIPYTNPITAAVQSFKNMALLLADFMYGTPERVRFTYAFAFALALLGGTMMGGSEQMLTACSAN